LFVHRRVLHRAAEDRLGLTAVAYSAAVPLVDGARWAAVTTAGAASTGRAANQTVAVGGPRARTWRGWRLRGGCAG